jgi:hypothetical protein
MSIEQVQDTTEYVSDIEDAVTAERLRGPFGDRQKLLATLSGAIDGLQQIFNEQAGDLEWIADEFSEALLEDVADKINAVRPKLTYEGSIDQRREPPDDAEVRLDDGPAWVDLSKIDDDLPIPRLVLAKYSFSQYGYDFELELQFTLVSVHPASEKYPKGVAEYDVQLIWNYGCNTNAEIVEWYSNQRRNAGRRG